MHNRKRWYQVVSILGVNIALLGWEIYNHKSKVTKFCTRYMMVIQRWGHSKYSCSKRDMAIPEPYWNPRDRWEGLFSFVLWNNYCLVFNSASWCQLPQFILFYDSRLHLLGAPSSEIILCSHIEVSFRGYVFWGLSSFVKLLPDPWGLWLF